MITAISVGLIFISTSITIFIALHDCRKLLAYKERQVEQEYLGGQYAE